MVRKRRAMSGRWVLGLALMLPGSLHAQEGPPAARPDTAVAMNRASDAEHLGESPSDHGPAAPATGLLTSPGQSPEPTASEPTASESDAPEPTASESDAPEPDSSPNQEQGEPLAVPMRELPSEIWGGEGGSSASPPLSGELIEGLRVKELRVQGNLKIERAAILATLQTREGGLIHVSQLRRDVKAVYALGYFRDVQVDAGWVGEEIVLTFIVVEKPSVRTVRLDGNDKLEKDDIQEVITLKLFSILNEANIAEDAVHIKSLYAEKGYYLAEVTYEVRPLNENEVEVIFKIKENEKVLVRRIYFLGTEKLKDSEFRRFLQIKEGGFLPFLTSAGTFNEDLLENDALIVQAYYNEKGYIQARVDPPHAFMSPDKKGIYVTYRVAEGERYKIGTLKVSGDLIEDAATLEQLLNTAPGDWFSQSALQTDIQALQDFYSDHGYAFASVIPEPQIEESTRTVNLVFDIEKGNSIRLEDINITGNAVTWDKTIRREIPIIEGETYSGSGMKEGKRRLERLGYFEEVKISTPKAGTDDALNLETDVTEKQTGTFNVGAGFSSLENFIFNANISKQNFLGLGYVMGASAQLSALRQQYNLSFFDPYFADTRWTLRADAYNIDTAYYLSEWRRGLDFALGHYLGRTDDARFQLKYTFETVGIRSLTPSRQLYFGGELFRGGDVSSLEASVTVDKRNNRITATRGFLFSASAELAGGIRTGERELATLLGGDFNFHRYQINFRFYQPLYKKIEDLLVFRVNSTLGAIWSTDGRMLPLMQRYRAGGINSVRGFYILSLGPTLRVTTNDNPSHRDDPLVVGGYQIMTTNFELEFAILKSAGIRGVVFLDAGNAFDLFEFDQLYTDDQAVIVTDQYPRVGTGFGVRWFSPMGPLRFEWGFPLTPREGDKPKLFEFTIGSFF